MSLPFRDDNAKRPNNRKQAVVRRCSSSIYNLLLLVFIIIYLGFLWINPINSQSKKIIEYQVTTLFFRKVSSPDAATFSLRKAADHTNNLNTFGRHPEHQPIPIKPFHTQGTAHMP